MPVLDGFRNLTQPAQISLDSSIALATRALRNSTANLRKSADGFR